MWITGRGQDFVAALAPLPDEPLPEEPLPDELLFDDLLSDDDLLSEEDEEEDGEEEAEVEVAGADSDLLSEVAGFSALTFPARESLR